MSIGPKLPLLVFTFIAACVLPLYGQFTSNIQGVVQDQSRAAVPGVTLTLRNLANDVQQTTKTSESGVYRFSSLQPGNYEVSVAAAGFQAQTLGVTLQTAQTADVNVTLAVAAASQA